LDPWQIILALAAVVGSMAAAYSKLVVSVNNATEKREERGLRQTELLMELVRNNTQALDKVCSQGAVTASALEDHDAQAKEILHDVKDIRTDVKDIKAYLEPPPKRAGQSEP
jgi:hypothetical protein